MKYKLIIVGLIIISLLSSNIFASGLGTTNTNTENNNHHNHSHTRGLGTNSTMRYEDKTSINPYYEVKLPNNNFLDSSSVNSIEEYSPTNLNRGFCVIDHIGHKDTAFTGDRHIATFNSGIQWFGYDAANNTDMILTNKDIDGRNLDISLDQSPVRADWHTIDGSGIVFNAKTNAPSNADNLTSTSYTFEGYALVATSSKIELRYYPTTTFSALASGGSTYDVLFDIPKTCNSQSFRVKYNGTNALIYLDNKLLTKQPIKYVGDYIGAMVDYMEHNCNSLSSVYMYNLIVNGKNYFEKEVK